MRKSIQKELLAQMSPTEQEVFKASLPRITQAYDCVMQAFKVVQSPGDQTAAQVTFRTALTLLRDICNEHLEAVNAVIDVSVLLEADDKFVC